MLVGREPDPPYERPPASKGYLAGTQDRDACLFHDEAWYSSRSIRLAPRTSVMRLDTDARTATLSTKEVVEFGVALIATGANVRRLRVDGAQLEGIHYLRALGNADAIRADALEAEHVVLVGGSYIACEVAATLTTLGRRCTMVMLEDAPLAAHFGATAGELLRRAVARARRRARLRRRARAPRGRHPRAARRLRLGPRAPRRHGRDGHRRDARRDARARGRARAGGERRRRLLGRPRDVGARHLGRRRHVRVRLRAARAPRQDRAFRGRARAGRGGGRGDARDPPAVLRGALLLDRPVGLVHRGVGRDHRGARAGDRPRVRGGRRLQRAAPRRRPARRRAVDRAR